MAAKILNFNENINNNILVDPIFTELEIADMKRQLESQAIKLANLELKLQEEKLSKINLEIDFEHALKQLHALEQLYYSKNFSNCNLSAACA